MTTTTLPKFHEKTGNITGQQFGELLVTEPTDRRSHKGLIWKCTCSCGKTCFVPSFNLQNGDTKSCGCLQTKKIKTPSTTHKMSKTIIRKIWFSMIQRCHDPRQEAYKNYGAKGIKVCDHWHNSFEAFSEDMGACPLGSTLERKNNDKGYFPENCYYATWII